MRGIVAEYNWIETDREREREREREMTVALDQRMKNNKKMTSQATQKE